MNSILTRKSNKINAGHNAKKICRLKKPMNSNSDKSKKYKRLERHQIIPMKHAMQQSNRQACKENQYHNTRINLLSFEKSTDPHKLIDELRCCISSIKCGRFFQWF
jgi:hypothetical protein